VNLQQREKDLEEHVKKDLELQKQLKDKLRYENDPKEKSKLENDLKEVNSKIGEHEAELKELTKEKREHEREALAREIPYVTFDELDIVTKFILPMASASSEISFDLTDIREKISRNSLTEEVSFLLTMGMGKAKEVGRFIEHNAFLRPDFPQKLKAGFVTEYQRLWDAGIQGDDLFEHLRQFSCGNSPDFKRAAAGLAVLSYLFERCEVFER
jgi:hypothetical protein